jgi:hypothetical protein
MVPIGSGEIVNIAQIGDYRLFILLICKGISTYTYGGAVWFQLF